MSSEHPDHEREQAPKSTSARGEVAALLVVVILLLVLGCWIYFTWLVD